MEENILAPCVNWQKKLAALHPDDLSSAERAVLNAHMIDCPRCATDLTDDKMDSLIRETLVSPLELPAWLTQDDLATKLPPLPAHRLYQNLPPRFHDFLGRQAELARVVEGLNSPHSLLVIEGIGGVGKTTLAIEVAYQCLGGSDLVPHSLFDSIIWISTRGRLDQKRWLSEILSTIADVLDYPSIAQLSFDERRAGVNDLLRTSRSLVIIDNFDTTADPGLLTWIQQIPKPSKVLITSRDMHQLHHAWSLHLKGLEGDDALELIRRRTQMLGLSVMKGPEVRDLLHVTRGNPQAIAMTLGDLKGGELSLHQVLDGLRGAGDILDRLFMRSWDALGSNLDAQQTLLAMSFFADSASEEALGAVVGMPLEQALERLVELSLIEVYKNGEQTRYGLHPLIRVFIGTKRKDVPNWEQEARKRWLEWWLSFTKAHGGPDGMEWAEQYDLIEREWENILVVCEWCLAHDQYETLQAFWHSERLLWITSIYGCWKERLFWLQRIGEAALRRGDKATAIGTKVEQGFTLTQMGRVDEAKKALNEAWEERHLVDLEVQLALTENLVQWHIRTNNFAGAQGWLKEADQLVRNPGLNESERPRHKLTIKYYYGVMYIAERDRASAERFFNETFDGARQINWQRCMIYAQQFLADIARAQGLFEKAEGLLKTGLEIVERNKDRRRTAYYKRSLAYLALQQWRRNNEPNKLNEVIDWAQQALDGFERLGMQREVNRLRRLLGRVSSAPLSSVEDVLQEQTEVYPLMA